MTVDEEARDIEARIRLLREASRPSEPLEERIDRDSMVREFFNVGASRATETRVSAQGHILSALTQLERRRAELLRKKGQ
jgi:hypothetical protein